MHFINSVFNATLCALYIIAYLRKNIGLSVTELMKISRNGQVKYRGNHIEFSLCSKIQEANKF